MSDPAWLWVIHWMISLVFSVIWGPAGCSLVLPALKLDGAPAVQKRGRRYFCSRCEQLARASAVVESLRITRTGAHPWRSRVGLEWLAAVPVCFKDPVLHSRRGPFKRRARPPSAAPRPPPPGPPLPAALSAGRGGSAARAGRAERSGRQQSCGAAGLRGGAGTRGEEPAGLRARARGSPAL